jgi:hypothetical protein
VGYGIGFVVSVATGSGTGAGKGVDVSSGVGFAAVVIGVTGTDTRGVVRIPGVTGSVVLPGPVVLIAGCGVIHPAERMPKIINAPVKNHSIFQFMIFS